MKIAKEIEAKKIAEEKEAELRRIAAEAERVAKE
jgi:hypothetical protein